MEASTTEIEDMFLPQCKLCPHTEVYEVYGPVTEKWPSEVTLYYRSLPPIFWKDLPPFCGHCWLFWSNGGNGWSTGLAVYKDKIIRYANPAEWRKRDVISPELAEATKYLPKPKPKRSPAWHKLLRKIS